MATSTAAVGKVPIEQLDWWVPPCFDYCFLPSSSPLPPPPSSLFPAPSSLPFHTQVEMQHRKEQSMPRGWGVDKSGMVSPSSLTTACKPPNHSYLQETTDPSATLNGGGLMPLGGNELTGRSLVAAVLLSLTHTHAHICPTPMQLATRAMGWR